MAWAFDVAAGPDDVRSYRSGIRFGVALFAALGPSTLLDNLRRVGVVPLPDPAPVVAAIGLAAAAGAAAGRWLAGRRAMLPMAAAVVVLVATMGGPVPIVNAARAAWLFAAFLPICVLSGIALVAARRVFGSA